LRSLNTVVSTDSSGRKDFAVFLIGNVSAEGIGAGGGATAVLNDAVLSTVGVIFCVVDGLAVLLVAFLVVGLAGVFFFCADTFVMLQTNANNMMYLKI
jgi:hypothetical protein